MGITKIFLVGVVIVAVMVTAQQQRWPQRFGVVSTCAPAAPPTLSATGYWYVCKQGIVNGFPNLEGDGCDRIGLVAHRDVWQCTTPVKSLPGA